MLDNINGYGFKKRFGQALTVLTGSAVVALTPLGVRDVQALPIFACKYKTSCMTCHQMFPRLNAFGEAFRLNGFMWPTGADADAEQRKQEPIPLGAEAFKKAFPNAVWPTELPEGVPLSIRGINTFTQHVGKDKSKVYETEWELQSGGNMGEKITWFGHANFVADQTSAAKTPPMLHVIAQINIEDLVGSRLVNLQLGTVAVEESDYYHYRNHSTQSLLPAEARPLAGSDKVPYPANFFKANLFHLRRGPGAMFWGRTARSDYSLGYRIGDDQGGGQDQNVGFFHWAYKIGGMDHYGQTTQSFPQGYMENSLSLGLFGDVGSADVQPTAASSFRTDKFWRAGGDLLLKLEAWSLRSGSYKGSNSNPYGTLNDGSADYTNWFVQTDYQVLPWLLPEVTYEETYWTLPGGLAFGKTDRARLVPSVNALYGANVRFTLFGEIYTSKAETPQGAALDANTVGAMVDWGI